MLGVAEPKATARGQAPTLKKAEGGGHSQGLGPRCRQKTGAGSQLSASSSFPLATRRSERFPIRALPASTIGHPERNSDREVLGSGGWPEENCCWRKTGASSHAIGHPEFRHQRLPQRRPKQHRQFKPAGGAGGGDSRVPRSYRQPIGHPESRPPRLQPAQLTLSLRRQWRRELSVCAMAAGGFRKAWGTGGQPAGSPAIKGQSGGPGRLSAPAQGLSKASAAPEAFGRPGAPADSQPAGAPGQDEEEEDDVVTPKPPIEPEEEKILKKDEENDSKAPPHELTEEEKQQILHTEEFLSFFDHSTRIVERALSEQINIFFDYSGRDLEDKEGEIQAGAKLSLNRQFFDERWSKHRVVSCLDWSSQYPELLVASYNNNEDAPHEPDGVALVWNMKYKKTTPEYVFHCQSAVMSATFAKFHPNLVVGGTYSGQIVLWDNRSNIKELQCKELHCQLPHTQRLCSFTIEYLVVPIRVASECVSFDHPVYCVNVVGTQNAHNLISISTDGKICSWSLDMLSHPQDSMELVHKQSKAVAVTSMSFPVGDVNNFVVGSEEGSVYTACRHGRFVKLERNCGPRGCGGHRGGSRPILHTLTRPLPPWPPVPCLSAACSRRHSHVLTCGAVGAGTSSWCQWWLLPLMAPQEQGEVEKPSGAIEAGSRRLHLLTVLSDWDLLWHQLRVQVGLVPGAGASAGKAGISEMFEGHQGPITGIHCHAAVGAVDFSHLFVTSSFDWTVKLWTTKNNKPLYSFEDNSDYVYDVMWSPTHPALFACVDGMGRLDLWNLNNDTEVPTASISVEGNPALNRVRWTHSGREIAVGDSEGQIVIYDVGEQIAVPRNDEWARFGRTLAEINANRADAEEEAATRIPA
ncbi:hypothetical protein QTO34_002928 [Cnephaeus nilssonii]|uniref:Cytoplasmic dynein 1 intermediate chain 2 n=1 Tax=Cnephaeus nilssonii TaxID=3371016 RepID=A0AA40HTC5_CNENI|nr:hypothetical protein QTO34_002928 [Eptesicus nilssonii]